MNPRKVVAVSGGFDPMHIGHLEMMEKARALGDELVVIVNNDNWLKTKKGYAFMPEEERVALLTRYPFVDRVVLTDHVLNDPDRSVSRTLEAVRPDIFANGGDRGITNTPEGDVAERLGIEMVYGIGGGKVQSSSWMTAHAFTEANTDRSSWGFSRKHANGDTWQLRTVHLDPGAKAPLEPGLWILVEGDAAVQDTALETNTLFTVPGGASSEAVSRNGAVIIHVGI